MYDRSIYTKCKIITDLNIRQLTSMEFARSIISIAQTPSETEYFKSNSKVAIARTLHYSVSLRVGSFVLVYQHIIEQPALMASSQ